MSIPIRIPQVLCRYTNGRSELTVSAQTVGEALQELAQSEPAVYECVCDETGSVRRHINIFVNNNFIRDLNGLETKLKQRDVISVFQAVSGG